MKKETRFSTILDDEIYNNPFRVLGVQGITLDREYTELITLEIEEEFTLKTFSEYKKWKENLSNELCNKFFKSFREITTVKIRFLFPDSKGNYSRFI